MKENIICLSDSYKYSHWKQYPSNMVSMFDYAEARSGKVYPATVFFGMQYYIDKFLSVPITLRDIYEANDFADGHGIPFNRDGWLHILNEHDGFLPVEIRSATEGLLIPTGNALFTIESTDPEVPWIAGYLETLFMKIWYTSNIATRSYYVKEMIQKYWDKTVQEDAHFGINFAFHNFGDRGSSSVEAAAIGGMAHLTQFLGTDNFNAIKYAKRFYNEEVAGFSIPATEHSSTTAWGQENELQMIMNHIETNKDKDLIAAVCDSYDYLKTVKAVTSGEFKSKIESDEYSNFVIRPDSGDPLEMVERTLDIMEENNLKFAVNSKGYKKFNNYSIIWGDGIDMNVMEKLLQMLEKRGYSADNIAFGSGGWLMQQHDRDTQGWAVKCSSITVDEGAPVETGVVHEGRHEMVWESCEVQRDVFKDPITASNKKSKKGRLTLWYNHTSKEYFTDLVTFKTNDFPVTDMLNTVYKNGQRFKSTSLAEVREQSQD